MLTDFTPGGPTSEPQPKATTESYKFVVVNKAGETVWMADPNVEATDENGNSVVDFGKIEKLP